MYIEDMEDPVDVQFPGSNPFLVIFRVKKSKEWVSFTPFDNSPLDFQHSSAMKNVLSERFVVVHL